MFKNSVFKIYLSRLINKELTATLNISRLIKHELTATLNVCTHRWLPTMQYYLNKFNTYQLEDNFDHVGPDEDVGDPEGVDGLLVWMHHHD